MPFFKLGFLNAVDKSDYTLVEASLKKDAKKYLSQNKSIWHDKFAAFYALHIAAENLDHKMVELLLDYGADPNSKAEFMTPLIFATAQKNADQNKIIQICEALLKKGASQSCCVQSLHSHYALLNKLEGMMPIHIAASHGYVQVIELFFKYGAQVNALDGKNRTLIYIASACGQMAVVKMLLERGAKLDFNPKLDCKQAAFDNGHTEVYEFLKNYERQSGWKKLDDESIALVKVIPALETRITEIFNFKSYERTVSTKNLNTEIESAPTVQKFSEVSDDAVQAAAEEFEKQGGTVDWQKALPRKIVKTFVARSNNEIT
jgi:hypothetical protein